MGRYTCDDIKSALCISDMGIVVLYFWENHMMGDDVDTYAIRKGVYNWRPYVIKKGVFGVWTIWG